MDKITKFFISLVILGLVLMAFFKATKSGSGLISGSGTMAIMSCIALIYCRKAYREGSGLPRDIREIIADTPYRLEAIGTISQKNIIWLRKIIESYEHKKLIPDSELVCYEYDHGSLTDINTGEPAEYVMLTYYDEAPEPILESWQPSPGYTEHD